MLQSLNKSQVKTERMLILASTKYPNVFENSRAVRPLILKILRFYPYLKNEAEYTQYLKATYINAKKMLPLIDTEILSIEAHAHWGPQYQYQANYLKKFQKNLQKIKKLCQDTSILYYTMLPDNIPIDVRTYCVNFISPATI